MKAGSPGRVPRRWQGEGQPPALPGDSPTQGPSSAPSRGPPCHAAPHLSAGTPRPPPAPRAPQKEGAHCRPIPPHGAEPQRGSRCLFQVGGGGGPDPHCLPAPPSCSAAPGQAPLCSHTPRSRCNFTGNMHWEGAAKKKNQTSKFNKLRWEPQRSRWPAPLWLAPATPGSAAPPRSRAATAESQGPPTPLQGASWAGILGCLPREGKGDHGPHSRHQHPPPQPWGDACGPQEPVPTVHGCLTASRHQPSRPKSCYRSVFPWMELGQHEQPGEFFFPEHPKNQLVGQETAQGGGNGSPCHR